MIESVLIENKHITKTIKNPDGSYQDGIGVCDGKHYEIKNCVIDLFSNAVDEMDEALAVTWGCSANIENCIIRGAGKLVLCGCGDADKIPIEHGKTVTFRNCILENFSRRGPEVQDGMIVKMYSCLIQNWGDTERFSVRSFAGWAHGEGSSIYAEDCIYKQDCFYRFNFIEDMIGHIGQAVNDSGILGLFSKAAWQPGVCKGLVATNGGIVHANHCYKNKWWINLENHTNPMSKEKADILEAKLNDMRLMLYAKFGID